MKRISVLIALFFALGVLTFSVCASAQTENSCDKGADSPGVYTSINDNFYKLCSSVSSESGTAQSVPDTVSWQPAVKDMVGYLSDEESAQISVLLEKIRREYNVDAAVVTVDSYNQSSIRAAADDYYDYNGYGAGSDYSGFMLMICKETREYYITTCGSSIGVMNDTNINYLCVNVESYLKKDDYYNACRVFAERAYEIYTDYENGEEFDPLDFQSNTVYYVVAWLIAAVLALIATLFAKSTMNDAVRKAAANEYVKQGSINITKSHDVFLYSTVTKTKRVQNSSGSSTHTSSSGRSHGGGGGSF